LLKWHLTSNARVCSSKNGNWLLLTTLAIKFAWRSGVETQRLLDKKTALLLPLKVQKLVTTKVIYRKSLLKFKAQL
jgi:hypothetical protein